MKEKRISHCTFNLCSFGVNEEYSNVVLYFSSVLFNDAINCQDYAAFVIEE
jgi:hypothetical protein